MSDGESEYLASMGPARRLVEELCAEGLVVSLDVAIFLLTVPDPRRYMYKAIRQRERMGLEIPEIILLEHLFVTPQARRRAP